MSRYRARILGADKRHARRIVAWWYARDRRYGWRWRVANLLAAALILSTVIIPVAQELINAGRYKLSAEALQLTGHTDASLAKQLTFDTAKQEYVFNQDAIAKDNMPSQQLKNSTGAENKSNTKAYALNVSADMSRGVTYHDTNSQLSFKLVPQYKALPGKTVDGHIVFPLNGDNGGGQAVYTLKNNGLKEDILVPRASADTMNLSYTLDLPKTLEARVIPNSGGAIGIYSADPALFGDITFGSDNDQQRIQAARENGVKSTLVFGLPAPYIKAAQGKSIGKATAHYSLDGSKLSVIAENLKSVDGAFTIDPSVIVTSTSDFQTAGNDGGNISFGTAGQITRGGLTGGSVSGGWSSSTSFTTGRYGHKTVAYNGYMYLLGGCSAGAVGSCSTYQNDVQYAAINSDGTLGTWASTTSFTTARESLGAFAYSGYLYIAGGYSGSNLSDVQYAPINADGTVGTWTATTSFTTARRAMSLVASGGNLYVLGGYDGSTYYATAQYAPINGNGTVGSWTGTTSFTTGRYGLSSLVNNGYMYVLGGCSAGTCTTYKNDVQYAPINADGTIGTWTTSTAFTTARYGQVAAIYNGYLYVYGGYSGSYQNDTQYALINANGSVGAWQTSATFTNARLLADGTSYAGRLYVLGGRDGSTLYADSQRATIDTAGVTGAYTTSGNTFTTTRRGAVTVFYDDYLYVMGGDNGGTPVNTIYTALVSADGSVGTFTATGMTAFTTNRTYFAAVAYNGYMYVLGGCSSAVSSCTTAGNNLATVYKSTIASDGTLGAWSAQTSFTTARYGLSAFAYNGYMYIMGGLNGSTFQADVQYHAFGASGAISGAWTAAGGTYDIPTARAAFGSTVYGGYVYVAGGCSAGNLATCTTARSDVQYAQLKTDNTGGFTGAFASTSSFTNARYGLGLTATNGHLYLTGGYDGSTYYADTQYVPVNTAGTVGTWASTTSFSNARFGIGSVVANGFLYVTGGYDGSTYYNNVQYAAINNGGSGQSLTWTTGGNLACDGAANTGHRLGASAAYNGYLYILGGLCTSNSRVNDVQYAPLSSTGAIGTWTTDSHTFSGVRASAAAAAYNGYLYILGGLDMAGTYYKDIQYAPIGTSGALTGNFASAGSNTTLTGGQGVCALAYKGYIYEVGGWDALTNSAYTSYAPINANGTIGSWADAGNNYALARSNGACFQANGYLYLTGGDGDGGTTNDVQYAPINSNGTLGAWKYTTSFNGSRYDHVAAAYNGFAYIFGGAQFSGQNSRDIQYAPINANGTLGTWQQTTNSMSSQHGGLVAGGAYNGYVYALGGTDDFGYLATTESAPLQSVQRSGRYSKLVDMGAAVSVSGLSTNGTLPTSSLTPGVAPLTFKAAGSNGVFGSSALPSSIVAGPTACSASNLPDTRYMLVTLQLDDSTYGSAVFPDSGSSSANLTDFTVSYAIPHPAPNVRLKLGKTLQSGNPGALDTCTP